MNFNKNKIKRRNILEIKKIKNINANGINNIYGFIDINEIILFN